MDERFEMWKDLIPGYPGNLSKAERNRLKKEFLDVWGYEAHEVNPDDYAFILSEDEYAETVLSLQRKYNLNCEEQKLTIDDFKRAQEALIKAQVPATYTYLDCLPQATIPGCDCSWCKEIEAKKKEHTMNYGTNANFTVNAQTAPDPVVFQREYLNSRVREEYDTKKTAVRPQFHMDDDKAPKNPADMLARIKAGNFVFNTEYVNEDGTWKKPEWTEYGYDPAHYLRWRTVPADLAGYNAWKEKAKIARQTAWDKIAALTPAEGLAALQEFQSTTIN